LAVKVLWRKTKPLTTAATGELLASSVTAVIRRSNSCTNPLLGGARSQLNS